MLGSSARPATPMGASTSADLPSPYAQAGIVSNDGCVLIGGVSRTGKYSRKQSDVHDSGTGVIRDRHFGSRFTYKAGRLSKSTLQDGSRE